MQCFPLYPWCLSQQCITRDSTYTAGPSLLCHVQYNLSKAATQMTERKWPDYRGWSDVQMCRSGKNTVIQWPFLRGQCPRGGCTGGSTVHLGYSQSWGSAGERGTRQHFLPAASLSYDFHSVNTEHCLTQNTCVNTVTYTCVNTVTYTSVNTVT